MSSDIKLKQSILEYVNAATALAESVKRNIVKGRQNPPVIDDKTVIALNNFIIAANSIKDFTNHLEQDTIKLN